MAVILCRREGEMRRFLRTCEKEGAGRMGEPCRLEYEKV